MHDLDISESDFSQPDKKVTSSNNGYNQNAAKLPCRNPAYTHRLPTIFQHMTNISIFLKNNASKPLFTISHHKKINGLIEKDAFKIVTILNLLSRIRIFNSRFVDKIKNEETVIAFKKS